MEALLTHTICARAAQWEIQILRHWARTRYPDILEYVNIIV